MAALGERRTARRLRLAALILSWERLWPALAPALGVIALFLILALFDLPERLAPWLQLALLIGLATLLVVALVAGLRRFRLPGRASAQRRIERESGLDHRPLAALDDRISGGADDPEAQALWQAHRARMTDAARSLRVGWPQAGLARRDPWAVRALLVLLLVLGAIDAGPDWAQRIARSLTPPLTGGVGVAAASLDIWLTPPDYTGLPPQLLPAKAGTTPIPVPAGSVVLAQVHGRGGVPRLRVDGNDRDFDRIDEDNFKAQATPSKSGALAVWQGGTALGRWPIAIVPDQPPTVALAAPPRQTEHGAMRLEYHATDDYGVEGVKAGMVLVDNPEVTPLELDLALPGLHEKDAHGVAYNDLTASPWAGLAVRLRLEARDALGQTGTSAVVTYTLPERLFHHPVARAIVAQRKELTVHPEDRDTIAAKLADLSVRPGRYDGDIVVFLALRMAQARLELNRDPETVPAVQKLLWQTALRIEDGRAPLMQQGLRQAMQALQDALARNAPQAEIDRLTEQLRQAMNRYVQAMAQKAQREAARNQRGANPSQSAVTPRDLEQMLDRAQKLAQAGARDAARDLLDQLQEMLENMQMGRMGAQSESQRMMGAMQKMMQHQRQLLDRSFRDSRAGKTEEQGAAQSQEGLRKSLGEMMRRLGENGDIPQALQRAERAMRGASGALSKGRPGDAIRPQTDALDQLQQGARRMGEQMAGRKNGNGSNDYGEPGDEAAPHQAQRDPFGRSRPYDEGNGWVDDGGAMRRGGGPEIDTSLRRAKTILDELRRRAGERARPEIERDYIDRLLKEF